MGEVDPPRFGPRFSGPGHNLPGDLDFLGAGWPGEQQLEGALDPFCFAIGHVANQTFREVLGLCGYKVVIEKEERLGSDRADVSLFRRRVGLAASNNVAKLLRSQRAV